MVIEMASGSLPWANLDALKQHKMIAEAKKFARTAGRAQLFEGCPKEYDELMDVIDNCTFYERPNYHKLASILEAAIDRLKIDRNSLLDWQMPEYNLLKRAEHIGDLGESNLLSARLKESKSDENIHPHYQVDDDPQLFSCSSPEPLVPVPGSSMLPVPVPDVSMAPIPPPSNKSDPPAAMIQPEEAHLHPSQIIADAVAAAFNNNEDQKTQSDRSSEVHTPPNI